MKNLNKLSSKLAAVTAFAFLFAGCAGITDSNLAELNTDQMDNGLERLNDGFVDDEKNTPPVTIFSGGVREDIVIVRPKDEDEDDRD